MFKPRYLSCERCRADTEIVEQLHEFKAPAETGIKVEKKLQPEASDRRDSRLNRIAMSPEQIHPNEFITTKRSMAVVGICTVSLCRQTKRPGAAAAVVLRNDGYHQPPVPGEDEHDEVFIHVGRESAILKCASLRRETLEYPRFENP